MKKHTRIGLMVLVTVVLMLALSVPSLAKKPETYSCNIGTVIVSSGGNTSYIYEIGELEGLLPKLTIKYGVVVDT